MKKIKTKIINYYNQYLSLVSKKISIFFRSIKITKNANIKIKLINQRISREIKKIFIYIVLLGFMKNKKVNISVFSRYLILLLVSLFSYIFYLASPSFYNFEKLQSDLSSKLLNEFKLNAVLSSNIKYKILPLPHFEISNVILSTDQDNNFNKFAEIKKMKIYVSQLNLHKQKMLEIDKVLFLDSNFNINNNSYTYINNFFKKKLTNKIIEIKKSKIFFTNKIDKKDAVAITSIKNSEIYFNSKNNSNELSIRGLGFNNNFNYNFSRNINNIEQSNTELILNDLNAKINNNLFKADDQSMTHYGSSNITFLGSDILIDYKFNDKLILLSSNKSYVGGGRKVFFDGKINKSPFYFDINLELDSLNLIKLIDSLYKIKNLFTKKIFLDNSFNGKLSIKINSIDNFKFFNEANIFLNFVNGELIFDETNLFSDKIGKLIFVDGKITEKNNEQFLQSTILFEIINQKKFYQKMQILRDNRIKIKNIHLKLEKNINDGDFIIKKFTINSNIENNSIYKTIDIGNIFDVNDIKNINNWIELKNYTNTLFSEIK